MTADMTSAENTNAIYSAAPALPALADALLSKLPGTESQSFQTTSAATLPQSDTDAANAWNLKYDIDSGVQPSGDTVFRYGQVTGFSWLRGKDIDNNPGSVAQVPLRLLTTHLYKSPGGITFIVHPVGFEPFSPRSLLASLLSSTRSPAFTREGAIRKLNSVQLFPVYDMRAITQAISDVSDALRKFQDERDHSRHLSKSGCNQEGSDVRHYAPALLIIAALDTLTEDVIRASNPGKGAAVLAATMRTLTQLSRAHASFLSVMLVNMSGLGALSPRPAQSSELGLGGPGQRESPQIHYDSIHSAFHQTAAPLFPSLLLRTLDQGIDAHLLLSNVGTTQVVEVVKDRGGGGVGKWSICE